MGEIEWLETLYAEWKPGSPVSRKEAFRDIAMPGVPDVADSDKAAAQGSPSLGFRFTLLMDDGSKQLALSQHSKLQRTLFVHSLEKC